jgi:2-haloacid dehalogenase
MKKPFHLVSFDCYGTLIDWEVGILQVLRAICNEHQTHASDEELLQAYSRFEPEAEAGVYKSYREVLTTVMQRFSQHYQWHLKPSQLTLLAETLPEWPLFQDTRGSLLRLREQFQVGIISNIDNDLIEQTLKKGGLKVDFITTAQDCKSYKPSEEPFRKALWKSNGPPGGILHCGCSIYHDIAPARTSGMHTAWINRRKGKSGSGATPPGGTTAHETFDSLTELTDWLLF